MATGQNNWLSNMFSNAAGVIGNTTSSTEAARMGAFNEKVRTDNAAGWVSNLNAETQRYDQALNVEAKKALDDPSYIPANFNSREEFQSFYNQAKTERDQNNFYSPSTITRGFGQVAGNQYRNITGYAPYVLGRGKRLDENESVATDIVGPDGNTISGYKPVVRSMRQDGSGNVQLYNADATFGGRPVADIAKEGGPEAVAANTVEAIPFSVEDQDFYGYMSGLLQRGNMRRDTAYMDTVDGGTADLDLDAPSREASEQRLLEIAVEQGILSQEEAQARLATARADFKTQQEQQAQTTPTETDDSTTADTTDETTVKPGTSTPETHLKFGDEPEGKVYGFGELSKRLPIYVGAMGTPASGRGGDRTKRMLEKDFPNYAGDYVRDPSSPYPFGMSQRQFESGTIKDGQRALKADQTISEFNVKQALYDKTDMLRGHWSRLDLTDPEIVNRLEYLEGDTFTEGKAGLSEVERAEIDVVKKFYGEQTSNKQLEKIFLENPAAFKEYYADPYNFAIKYADNLEALVPPTITPREKIDAGMKPSEVKKVDTNAIVEIAENTPVITQEHILTLEKEVEKLGTVSSEAQEKLAEFLANKDKRVNDLSKQERAFFVTNFMAATDKDDPMYRVLAQTFPVFMQTGDYSTWEEEMRLKWAEYSQNQEKIEQDWVQLETSRQSSDTSLLNLQFNIKKYNDTRTATFNDGSEAGKRYSEDREAMAFYTNWKDGNVSEITFDQAAPFMNSVSNQATELASSIAQGVFGQEQKADLQRVQADTSLVLKAMLTKVSNENLGPVRKFFSFFGADFNLDPNGFEVNRKVVGLDANNRMTDDPDAIVKFHVVDDASLTLEGNPMSRQELQAIFGGDAGIQALMAIVLPTHAERRKKGLE